MARCKVVVFDITGSVRFVSGTVTPDELEEIWSIINGVAHKLMDNVTYRIKRNNRDLLVKLAGDLIAVLWYDSD